MTLVSSGVRVKALDDSRSEPLTELLFLGNVLLNPSAEWTLLHYNKKSRKKKQYSNPWCYNITFPSFALLLLLLLIDADVKLFVVGLSIGSTAGSPTSVSKSASIADFSRTSKGLSQPRDGERFTSNSHGFRFASIRISKP